MTWEIHSSEGGSTGRRGRRVALNALQDRVDEVRSRTRGIVGGRLPERLPWRSVARATLIAAGGAAPQSARFALLLEPGANVQQHHASSAGAALVFTAIWLSLSNGLLLAGYRPVDPA